MVTLSEQETTIQFNRDGKACIIWTSDSTMMTKLDRLCKESPENYKLTKTSRAQDGDIAGKQYELADKKLITFRNKSKAESMTEEQREKRRELARRNFGLSHNNSDEQS